MRVGEVMSRGVDPVDPAASVQEAAVQMAELDVGAVFVGTEGTLSGVLTDRDIILRVVVEGSNPKTVKVGEVMSKTLFSCRESDPVETVLATMRERQIRRMPVFDDEGQALGVVVLSDLAKAVSSPEQVREALREISEPHRKRKEEDTDEAAGTAAGPQPAERRRGAAANDA